MPSHFLAGPPPRIFAHRGWHVGDSAGKGPGENTIEAFRRAAEKGIRYLETDVQTTADGVLVAFHDLVLDRVTDGQGPVAQHTFDQLPRSDTHRIPRFDELLDLLTERPELRLNVDCKTDAAVQPLLDALAASDVADRICLAGFSTRRLIRLTAEARSRSLPVVRSLGPAEVACVAAGLLVPSARSSEVVAVQIPLRSRRVPLFTPRLVAKAHRAGLEVHVWTINDPVQMADVLDGGADGIITDRPELLRTLLRSRGSDRRSYPRRPG